MREGELMQVQVEKRVEIWFWIGQKGFAETVKGA